MAYTLKDGGSGGDDDDFDFQFHILCVNYLSGIYID
jgi:hypothetical protein